MVADQDDYMELDDHVWSDEDAPEFHDASSDSGEEDIEAAELADAAGLGELSAMRAFLTNVCVPFLRMLRSFSAWIAPRLRKLLGQQQQQLLQKVRKSAK